MTRSPDDFAKLTTEGQQQLTARIASLAAAGLPLHVGLDSLAAEVSDRREARWLRRAAELLERGAPPAEVFAPDEGLAAEHLRALLVAGMRRGQLVPVLAHRVEQLRAAGDIRRRVRTAIAYPLALMFLLGCLFAFYLFYVAPQITELILEFELETPPSTQFLMWLADSGFWIFTATAGAALLALVVLHLAGAQWIWHRAGWSLPLFGPLRRWSAYGEWSRLLGAQVALEIPLDEALDRTAAGLADRGLAHACQAFGRQVAKAQPLSGAAAARRAFPASIVHLLQWGEQHNNLAEACEGITEMCDGNVRLRASTLEAVLPPLTFLLIGVGSLALVNGLFSPLVKLVRALT